LADYESDHTRFMREYLEKHPEQIEEQRRGRALWWDKPQDFEAQRRFNEARVAQKPYPYQTDLTPTDAH
jgi:hypothetical protein